MAMEIDSYPALDAGLLLKSDKELVAFFRSLSDSETQDHQITSELLRQIHSSVLPPSILAKWLPIALRRGPAVLRQVIADPVSLNSRHIGLSLLHNLNRRKYHHRSRAWEAIGGMAGLKVLLKELSSQDVLRLTRTVVFDSVFSENMPSTEFDVLVKQLVPGFFQANASTVLKGNEIEGIRPHLDAFILFFHCCSDDLICHLLSHPLHPELRARNILSKLAVSHCALLRKIALGELPIDGKVPKLYEDEEAMVKLVEPREPYDVRLISSINSPIKCPEFCFCIDVLEFARDDIPEPVKRAMVRKLLACAPKAKMHFEQILVLLKHELNYTKTSDTNVASPMARRVIKLWALAAFPGAKDADMVKMPSLKPPTMPDPAYASQLMSAVDDVFEELRHRSTFRDSDLELLIRSNRSEGPVLCYLPRSARLEFVKKYCRSRGIDLEAEDMRHTFRDYSKGKHYIVKWQFFNYFPGADAAWLYEKLEDLAGSKHAVYLGDPTFAALRPPTEEDYGWYEKAVLRATFERGYAKDVHDFVHTRRALERLKEAADKCSAPTTRRDWVLSAFELVVTSRCLPMVKEVLLWAHRFFHDERIGHRAYKRVFLQRYENEYLNMISGLHLPEEQLPNTLLSLRNLVEESNSLLNAHIDLLLSLEKVPSFSMHRYGGVGLLFQSAVDGRAKKLRILQRRGLGTAHELGVILFDSLIPTLLRYEMIGLAKEHQALEEDVLYGALVDLTYESYMPPQVIAFLDRYARARDAAWAEARQDKNAAVSLIEDPFPKGLPAAYLFPEHEEWAIKALARPELAPYLMSRVEKVIFTPKELLTAPLPSNTEIIGPFVDDIRVNLVAYLEGVEGACLAERLCKVVRHLHEALGHKLRRYKRLTSIIQDALNRLEAKRAHPLSLELGLESKWRPDINPLPSGEHDASSCWNPWLFMTSGGLELADTTDTDTSECIVFDCLYNWKFQKNASGEWEKPDKPTPYKSNKSPLDIWQCPNARWLPLATQDSMAAAAILCLKSVCAKLEESEDEGMQNMPSEENQTPTTHYRGQEVCLDSDFCKAILDEEPLEVYKAATNALRKLINIVPVQPLQDLATTLLTSLARCSTESPNYDFLTRMTFKVLALFSRSDQLHLASELGLQAVKALPKLSTWHLKVLNTRFARLLPSEHAYMLALSYSAYISERLEAKKEERRTERPEKGVVIKVTTVKNMISLLGQLTTPGTALATLRRLFDATAHADVRKVIVKELLDLLCRDPVIGTEQTELVYQTLEHCWPVVAGPSEKIALSEGGWRKAEADGVPPVINTERPIMELLLVHAHDALPETFREKYCRKVVVPVIEKSAENCTRWMQLFMSRVQLSEKEKSFEDCGPFDNNIVDRVLKVWRRYLPKQYLLTHRRWALSYLEYLKLADIEQKLDEYEKGWEDTREGSYFSAHRFEANKDRRNFKTISTMLYEDKINSQDTLVQDGITQEDFAEEIYIRAGILLHNPLCYGKSGKPELSLEPFSDMWSTLTRPASRSGTSTVGSESQVRKLRDVLRKVVADIEQLRVANQENLTLPLLLPSQIELQLPLLPYPQLVSPRSEDSIDVFASAVCQLIDICVSNIFELDGFKKLKEMVPSQLLTEDLAPVATKIGTVPVRLQPTLQGYLRIRLATTILKEADREASCNVIDDPGVKAMLQSWIASPYEGVRAEALLQDKDTTKQFVTSELVKHVWVG